jgi:hypothetical protein
VGSACSPPLPFPVHSLPPVTFLPTEAYLVEGMEVPLTHMLLEDPRLR